MQFVLTTLQSVWEIVVFGILLGAGLPAVFALGLKALSPAAVATTGGAAVPLEQVPVGRRVLGGLCFLVVVGAIVTGIVFLIVTGHR